MPLLQRTPRRHSPGQRTRTRGFVLLEALVAIVLFVVGVLGILGLQAGMTRAQTETSFRSEAAHLAQELLGLMWADIPNLSDFTISDDACTAPACQRWLAKAKTTLPGGGAAITVAALTDGSTGSDVDITVTWTMPSGEARKYMTRSTIALSHTP
jgi:type IV pilus assembly protein PilV